MSTIQEVTELAKEITPMLTAIGLVVTAAVGLWNAIAIQKVHKLTNSMSDKLQAQAKVIGRAEGVAEERASVTLSDIAVAATHEKAADTQLGAAIIQKEVAEQKKE